MKDKFEEFDKDIRNSIAKEYTLHMKDNAPSPIYNPSQGHLIFQSFHEEDAEGQTSSQLDMNRKLASKKKSNHS